ncbi:hypothetical protein OF83DRAFT_1288873 [Amylostereum chailletii]|nr:hypothetical protein OF83DRAFT_1288873 [Amylostereum chailletii]
MDTILDTKVERTTVMVTHKLALMRLCDRIVVLRDGVVVEELGGGGVQAFVSTLIDSLAQTGGGKRNPMLNMDVSELRIVELCYSLFKFLNGDSGSNPTIWVLPVDDDGSFKIKKQLTYFIVTVGLIVTHGPLATFFERVPFVGFVIAGLQLYAGNKEQGTRALTHCANSSIVTIGAGIGVFFGRPAGAALGAGLTTPIGIMAERLIASNITDPMIRARFEEATSGRLLYETLRNTLTAGAAGCIVVVVSSTFSYIAYWLARAVGKGCVEMATYYGLKKLSDVFVKNKLQNEWQWTFRSAPKRE